MMSSPESFLGLNPTRTDRATLTACGTASSHLTPSGSTTTLMAGWEHHFAIDWTVEPEPDGGRRIRGYVTSKYGEYAEPLRVLAQALDSSGAVVGQRIVWVPGGVNGFQRAYFDVPHMPPAARYRVSVWDYSVHQSPRSDWL